MEAFSGFSLLIATYDWYSMTHSIISDSNWREHFQSDRDIKRIYEVHNNKLLCSKPFSAERLKTEVHFCIYTFLITWRGTLAQKQS